METSRLFLWAAILSMLTGCGSLAGADSPAFDALPFANSMNAVLPTVTSARGGNRSITLVTAMQRAFSRLDRDNSGGLSAEELPLTAESWRDMDQNGDGVLSWAEMQPTAEQLAALEKDQRQASDLHFTAIDANHDGKVERSELEAMPAMAYFQQDLRWFDHLGFPLDRAAFSQEIASLLADERLEAHRENPSGPGRNRTVFLLHGLWAPGWYYLYPLQRHLENNGFRVYALNFIPTLPRIEDYAGQFRAEVERRRQAGEFGRLELIGHSMGGLVGRYYLKSLGGASGVDNYVSICSPHQGSQLAWLAPLPITKELQPGSNFLQALNAGGLSQGVQHAALWSHTDGMVVPGENAQLQGATNFSAVPRSNHYLICWLATAFKQIDRALAY